MKYTCYASLTDGYLAPLNNPVQSAPPHPYPKPSMHLYNLTLEAPGAITAAVTGSFMGPRTQQVAMARGSVLELASVSEDQRLTSVSRVNVFGTIRSLAPLRLPGSKTDYLVVGSDSGKLTVLECDEAGELRVAAQETFGKSGCRRIVPGQYLATDPQGRAVMVAAIEKQKFVYILNRDSDSRLIVSSPLEAHKSTTLTYDCVGLHVGFDNPLFACLEVDYEAPSAAKTLTYYELDLGLNHVTRKASTGVPASASKLVAVPGDTTGPGGVLVCCEDLVVYASGAAEPLTVALPKRVGCSAPLLITAATVHRQKTLFFVLLQSEEGDLYKVSLTCRGKTVRGLTVQYLDTVPCAIALCLFKSGHLFSASEFGNHYLLSFTGIGDDEATPVLCESTEPVFFTPRCPPRNLALVDLSPSLSPVLSYTLADLTGEAMPQVYALCGRGARSSLRVLRYGLAVTEMAVSDVHGSPTAVWCTRASPSDAFHSWIVVGYSNATLVLAVGPDTVEEVFDSGYDTTTPTLLTGAMGLHTRVQVTARGVRFIHRDASYEWKSAEGRPVTRAAMTARHLVVALAGGELVYFAWDAAGADVREVARHDLGAEVCAVAVSGVRHGSSAPAFLAVATINNRVALFAVGAATDPFGEQVAVQDHKELCESLVLVEVGGAALLCAGLRNGVLVRSRIEQGGLSDTRKTFLGTRPVSLHTVTLHGQAAVVALSSRSWVCYAYGRQTRVSPVSYEALACVADFASDQCPEGLVAVAGTTLRILALEQATGEVFNASTTALAYTPRRLAVHPGTQDLVVLEADHRAFSEAELAEVLAAPMDLDNEDDEEFAAELKSFVAPSRAEPGQWASQLRVVNPLTLETRAVVPLEPGEAGLSLCVTEFAERGTELFLVLGSVTDLVLAPRRFRAAHLSVFRFTKDHGLALVHRTAVDHLPTCVAGFQGRLLAGVGRALRIYDIGKSQLLRKCENKSFPSGVVWVESRGDRVFVGDASGSVFLAKYRRAEKQLLVLADSFAPRYLTTASVLDYNTVAGADKFGNLFVVRLPEDVSDDVDADPLSSEFVYGSEGWLGGANNKFRDVAHFYLGDTATHLGPVAFQPGDSTSLMYATVSGALGALIPFVSQEDIAFFSALETQMRQARPPLCGRDHLVYRSYYAPVKNTVDGDLCELYHHLPLTQQQAIAETLLCQPQDVVRRLEDLRARFV